MIWPDRTDSMPIVHGARDYWVKFADGKQCVCLTSGLWNVGLGYSNPIVQSSVERAWAEYSYAPLFRQTHVLAERLADRLLETIDGFASIFFATSGGSAVDLAVRIAREAVRLSENSSRGEMLACLSGSYHGTTLGVLPLLGEDLGQERFYLDLRRCRRLPTDDDEAADSIRKIGSRLAGFIVEPVLGSTGRVVSDQVLHAMFAHREQYNSVLIADEVATAFFRVGHWIASAAWAEPADIVVLSKALTNGVCAGSAVLMSERVSGALDSSDTVFVHGETSAGDATFCGAVSGVLDAWARSEAQSAALQQHQLLSDWVSSLDERHTRRGKGSFWYIGSPALDTEQAVLNVQAECRTRGVSVMAGDNSIGVMPSLLMPAEVLSDALGVLTEVLDGL